MINTWREEDPIKINRTRDILRQISPTQRSLGKHSHLMVHFWGIFIAQRFMSRNIRFTPACMHVPLNNESESAADSRNNQLNSPHVSPLPLLFFFVPSPFSFLLLFLLFPLLSSLLFPPFFSSLLLVSLPSPGLNLFRPLPYLFFFP